LSLLRRCRQHHPIKKYRGLTSISGLGLGLARSELEAAQESRAKAIGQSCIA
jgi:hypothetical protein